jgi:hypothetical protein
MGCTQIHELFTEFGDDTLDRQTRQEFQNHLTACPTCSSSLTEFQETIQELNALEFVQPPPDILSGIHARLAKTSILDRLLGIWHDLDFSFSIPAAAATIAIAMVAGFLVKNSPLMENTMVDRPVRLSQSLPAENIARSSMTQLATTQRSGPGGLPILPAHRGLQQAGYPHKTLTPEELASAHGASLLTLDLIVTDRSEHPDQQNILFRDLLTEGEWQIQRLQKGLLLVRLSPQQLPHLYQILARHQVSVTPSVSASNHLLHKNSMLNVAVRLK